MATATARIQVIIEAAEKAAAGIIDDAEAQARRYLEESRARADSIADERVQEMSGLTDSLIQQAETVKRQSDELIKALDQAKRQVHQRFGDESAPVVGPKETFLAPPVQEAPSEPAPVHHLKSVEPQADFPVEALPPQTPKAEDTSQGQTSTPPSPESPPPPSFSMPPPSPEPVEPSPGPSPPSQESPSPPPPVPGRPVGTPPSDGARLLATQMAVAGSSRIEIERCLQNEFGILDAGPMLDAILGREG